MLAQQEAELDPTQLPLRPAGTRSDCDVLLHCWHSIRTATAAPPPVSCPESANIPASKSPPAQIPTGSNNEYPYEWAAQVWITCTLISSYTQGFCCSDIRNRKQIWKATHILIQNISYKQHSFLKAGMASNQIENKDCIYRLYILPWV